MTISVTKYYIVSMMIQGKNERQGVIYSNGKVKARVVVQEVNIATKDFKL